MSVKKINAEDVKYMALALKEAVKAASAGEVRETLERVRR